VNRNQKKRFFIPIAALLCCGAATQKAAVAQLRQALPVADALKMRSFVGQPVFSPDGKWLEYAARDAGTALSEDDNSYALTGIPAIFRETDLYISNVETGETKNLTNGNGSNGLASWSPDSNRIAFVSGQQQP
jgi:Tol biopolymer transport system component